MRPEPVEVLLRAGGAAPAARLVEVCGRHAVRRAVAAGFVVRTARGSYALLGRDDALAEAVRLHGVASHASAAAAHGLGMTRLPDRPHVTVPRGRARVDARGTHVHRADLADHEHDGHVTSPLRTVLDCARSLDFPEALAVADSALRDRRTTGTALRRAAHALRGAGRQRVIRVAEAATALAANALESTCRGLLIRAGFTDLVPQLRVEDGHFLAFLDLGDPVLRLGFETDGFETHGTRQGLAHDCWRHTELLARGWWVARFSWEHTMFRQEWVLDRAERIRGRALAARKVRTPRIRVADVPLAASDLPTG